MSYTNPLRLAYERGVRLTAVSVIEMLREEGFNNEFRIARRSDNSETLRRRIVEYGYDIGEWTHVIARDFYEPLRMDAFGQRLGEDVFLFKSTEDAVWARLVL